MNDLSGTQLGQYHLIQPIGKGGMATVYRAHQASMGRDVAIKIISPELVTNTEFVARFHREVQIIAQLQHPHILAVYDSGRERGLTYLVMRLMAGGSLADELKAGPMPIARAIDLTKQIAAALDYAHQRGIVHRDLKPTNVLLDDSGNACLTDFGIAKAIQRSATTGLTTPGSVMGTPTYMAPEQWRSEPVDGRTDIYALGIITYYMLGGQVPFAAETPHGLMYQHLGQQPAPLRRLRPDLPPGVEQVLRRALAKDLEDRYPRASEFARDLEFALRFPNRQPQSAGQGIEPPRRPDRDLDDELIEDSLMRDPDRTMPPRTNSPSTASRPATPPPSAATMPPRTASQPTMQTPPYTLKTGTPSPRASSRPATSQQPPAPPGNQRPLHYTNPSGSYQRDSRPAQQTPPPSYTSQTTGYQNRQHTTAADRRPVNNLMRYLTIVASIVIALAVIGGIVLVIALVSRSGDDDNNSELPVPPTATVRPGQTPDAQGPTTTILAPPDNTAVALGAVITIQFAATDTVSGVTRVELRRLGRILDAQDVGPAITYQGRFLYPTDGTGVHELEIVAYRGDVAGPPATLRLDVR